MGQEEEDQEDQEDDRVSVASSCDSQQEDKKVKRSLTLGSEKKKIHKEQEVKQVEILVDVKDVETLQKRENTDGKEVVEIEVEVLSKVSAVQGTPVSDKRKPSSSSETESQPPSKKAKTSPSSKESVQKNISKSGEKQASILSFFQRFKPTVNEGSPDLKKKVNLKKKIEIVLKDEDDDIEILEKVTPNKLKVVGEKEPKVVSSSVGFFKVHEDSPMKGDVSDITDGSKNVLR